MSASRLAFSVFLLAAVARAAPVANEDARGVTFELKFGSLTPDVDRSPGLAGKTPYASTLGGSMLFAQIEVDRVFWHRVGALGLGASVGYGEKYATAHYANSPTSLAPEKTGLTLVPLKLLAFYRLDYGALQYGIPLVPYGKLGLIYEPWWATKGGGTDHATDGTSGTGGRFGYGLTGGLSFLLDVLEPRLAKDAEVDLGIHHTYVFAEYTSDVVRGFGSAGIDLSARYVMFGLALDF